MAKVSVVIAAKNEATHLKESLESVLLQAGLELEVVFVNDNSTDETKAIATELSARHSNLLIFDNPKAGKCSAFNFGVEKASGDFICIFAGDDIMPEGSLFDRLKALEGFAPQQPVVSLGKIRSFSEFKQFDGIIAPRKKGQGSLSGVSPLMSQAASRMIFPVPEHLPNEDTWMELAIMYLGEIQEVHTDIICCNWRVHSGNSINMLTDFPTYNKKITIRMSALKIFYERYSQRLSPTNKRKLAARVRCEEARKDGNVLKIFFSGATFIEKLRATALCNSFFYRIRSFAFKAFSGWGY